MNEDKAEEIAAKIFAGVKVSRWDITPYKRELKRLLKHDKEAFHAVVEQAKSALA